MDDGLFALIKEAAEIQKRYEIMRKKSPILIWKQR